MLILTYFPISSVPLHLGRASRSSLQVVSLPMTFPYILVRRLRARSTRYVTYSPVLDVSSYFEISWFWCIYGLMDM